MSKIWDSGAVVEDHPLLGTLTFAELHAGMIGLIGILPGLAWLAGFQREAFLASLLILGLAYLLRLLPGSRSASAARVTGKEPWYFTVIYLGAFLATLGLGGLI